MNRNRWRQLASGLLAATLSFGIAACDDDTSSGTGDMAVGGDMSASAGADMTMVGTKGTGQLVLADVVGTVFSPSLPGGAAPRTHTLLAIASLPKITPTSDPSSDLSLTGLQGCTINRYTTTNLPGGDGDAGTVTFTGWNPTTTIGVDVNTGSKSNGASLTPITCKRSATTMSYGCVYGGTFDPDGGAMGAPTGDVIYPIIPYYVVTATAHVQIAPVPTTSGGWPFGTAAFDASCSPRYVFNSMDTNAGMTNCNPMVQTGCVTQIEVCEQEPILGSGASQITEALTGGTDYGAGTKTLGNGGGTDGGALMFPGPLYIVSVTSGTTDITAFGPDFVTGGNDLSFADGKIDPTKSLTITYSCDPLNPTAGAGCTSATLAALLIQTSTATKERPAPALPAGVGQCIAKPTTGSISVSAAQMQALFGGQTGGSIKLALANLALSLAATNGHTLVYTAGAGIFGFTNQ